VSLLTIIFITLVTSTDTKSIEDVMNKNEMVSFLFEMKVEDNHEHQKGGLETNL
jgi:hypothetical protein